MAFFLGILKRRGVAQKGIFRQHHHIGGCVKRPFSPDTTKKYFERALVFLILPCKIKKTSARSLFYSSGRGGEILFTQPRLQQI
jgi:hypothetical protein